MLLLLLVALLPRSNSSQQHDVLPQSPPSYYIVFLDQTSLHCCMCHVPCLVWSSRGKSSQFTTVLACPCLSCLLCSPFFPFPVLCCCAIINNHNSNLLPLYCSLNPVYDVAFVSFLAAKKFWFDRDPLDKYCLWQRGNELYIVRNVYEIALRWFKRNVL